MEPATSPRKKLKSPAQDIPFNPKTSVTCTNVPEGLFDATTAKKHFSKFGRLQRIRLFSKRQICMIEYDQPSSAERAILNAGAFDGFMFEVTRLKGRIRRRSSRKDDDPDWVPDSDVEEELSAMGGTPTYRVTRQHHVEDKTSQKKLKAGTRSVNVTVGQPVVKKKIAAAYHPSITQPTSKRESPVPIPMIQAGMSTAEAATELYQLKFKVSLTPDEQWRTLDARDRILRSWGGAGSRVKLGGATIGTCQDMCPEKELLQRQAEHQIMTLETDLEDGEIAEGKPWGMRALKQYSRSSADQEIPMCYELRPAPVLTNTCAYLLREVADTDRQISTADWFHFMWDRLRSIRKDITQQALCCAESIRLVEQCARFHAHCAATLAGLRHAQFDPKLNTDNLTKCLQTLKHMYADVGPDLKPNEPEFRGYIALLNLGDANFWWEIKQLPREIQKSEPLVLATKIFNAIDNNNYVRFFRLVQQKATYLQACILLRYFNDVRARALARIVKAYAPRGGSKFPAVDMMNALAFESVDSMKSFINHYGLRFAKTDDAELSIILDRHQFIEDSDPYPTSRAIALIESKRNFTVGEVIAGGKLPAYNFRDHVLHSSFTKEGKLKEASLFAEDQGYNTINDSNKPLSTLKDEVTKFGHGETSQIHGKELIQNRTEAKPNLFMKPDPKTLSPSKPKNIFSSPGKSVASINAPKHFSFKPAIPVASTDIIKNSPEKIFDSDAKSIFSFSKPQESSDSGFYLVKNSAQSIKSTGFFDGKSNSKNIFVTNDENRDPFANGPNVFKQPVQSQITKSNNLFNQQAITKPETANLFNPSQPIAQAKTIFGQSTESIFGKPKDTDSLAMPDSTVKLSDRNNIFARPALPSEGEPSAGNIFGSFSKSNQLPETIKNNIFAKPNVDASIKAASIFGANGDVAKNKALSPGSIFKSAITPQNGPDSQPSSIFQNKNKGPTVADNLFNSVADRGSIYDFKTEEEQNQASEQRLLEEKIKAEKILQEEIKRKEEEMRVLERQQEEKRKELERQKEEKRLEDIRRKQEEIKRIEEQRRKEEERRQEELKQKIEKEKKAELKRIAEELEKKFRQKVDKESSALIENLVNEINDEEVSIILREEQNIYDDIIKYAKAVTEELIMVLNTEICESEMKSENFRIQKLRRKWCTIWKNQLTKNVKRRNLLENTPVWLTEYTPSEEATHLRRIVEDAVLKNMNAIHRGYIFNGELKQLPSPEPFNVMEIIRSPLLKRMKQIHYPYDKCFFWKVTLVSPGITKWLYKKINIDKFILDAFSDGKKHEASDSLIQVGKQSWNNLMDFAISVSMTRKNQIHSCCEAVDGTNGILLYGTESESNLSYTIETLMKNKYPYQVIPIALILPKAEESSDYSILESLLSNLVNNKVIAAYKIFILEPENIFESLLLANKTALKWLSKKYPATPPLEIDLVKSICQRYLGNEIWCRLKTERDGRFSEILKDLQKLVKCYNDAVDKLTEVITNEDLFNYPSFPLEFKLHLDDKSPYPKPYEFIPSNVKTSENISAIKDIMAKLKLPYPVAGFHPKSVTGLQQDIRKYCNQIGWFENPDEVVCRVVAILPNDISDLEMPQDQFSSYFAQYDLIDILNIIVYEKISRLNNFNNRFAMYESSVLMNYRNTNWLVDLEAVSKTKHKAIEYEDDLDYFIEAKRRKIAMDSIEYLILEDKDTTVVEENIKMADENISRYNSCSEAVKQLEEQIENEKKKSMELENLLKFALSDV